MTRIRKALQNRKGLSMVNVLASFAVLLFVLVMFNQSINLSTKIYQKSEDVRRAAENLFSLFYQNTTYVAKGQISDGENETECAFTFDDGKGGQFSIDTIEGFYQPDDSSDKVYYFGGRKAVNHTEEVTEP